MRIYDNGVYRDMTEEEFSEMAQAEREHYKESEQGEGDITDRVLALEKETLTTQLAIAELAEIMLGGVM